MNTYRSALCVALALALAATSASAFAGAEVYGSFELGRRTASNPVDTRVPFAYDAQLAGNPVQTVGHGAGMNHDFRVGMTFSVPAFLEFGTTGGELADKAQYGIDSATGACNVWSTLGLIYDCWNQANISQRIELRSRELVGGWRFDIAGQTRINPYIGLRKVTVHDTRFVNYNYLGGLSNRIADESFFDQQGPVAGVRVVQDFRQFYLSAELQVARANGARSRRVLDTEYHSATGAVTDTEIANRVDTISVRQRMARIGIGRRFDFGGLPSNISLGYQLNKTDGFDTRSTETNAYTPGQLGSGDVELETKGFFLRFEVNN